MTNDKSNSEEFCIFYFDDGIASLSKEQYFKFLSKLNNEELLSFLKGDFNVNTLKQYVIR